MTTVTITLLEVGYESNSTDTFDPCDPPMKAILKDHIPQAVRVAWTKPKTYVVPEGYSDDTWVAAYLQEEFDAAIGEDEVEIKEDDRRQLSPQSGVQPMGTEPSKSGSPGTRCQLQGDYWVNSRSYALVQPNGDTWPDDREPEDAMMFATVHWKCTQAG